MRRDVGVVEASSMKQNPDDSKTLDELHMEIGDYVAVTIYDRDTVREREREKRDREMRDKTRQ